MRPIVEPSFARQRQSDIVLADVRWYLDGRSGRAAYARGHLPGAVFVDLERWLSGPPSAEAGRHPLLDPAVFAAGMAGLGIGDDTVVVAYDDQGGVIAARLVWMLRATGHPAALLDGGLAGFGGELELATAPRPPAVFTPRPWPTARVADIDDAVDERSVVIDARNRDRYRGEHEPLDPRAGHIPGAISLPCRENLEPSGRLLGVDEIRRRFRDVGIGAGTAVVSYCGSGITACHNLLAMEHAGLGEGRLYPGSWSQYSHARGRPLATGPDPT